jgi:hypothetical protein
MILPVTLPIMCTFYCYFILYVTRYFREALPNVYFTYNPQDLTREERPKKKSSRPGTRAANRAKGENGNNVTVDMTTNEDTKPKTAAKGKRS